MKRNNKIFFCRLTAFLLLFSSVLAHSSVENYSDDFSNLRYSTGTNKKLCGLSVRYPDGLGNISQSRYQRFLQRFAGDMSDWSRGKIAYDRVLTARQAVMPDNTKQSKATLIRRAKAGAGLGSCDLNVIKGAFSGSNAPSRTQANCGGSGLASYCLRHEAGHTWGLAHDSIFNGDTCTRERGASQMSGYRTGFNIPHLHWLGWLEENQVKQLQWDDPNQDDYVFGEHWISIRPLSVNSPRDEGKHPYGLVVDLRRSGNRLWLASNNEKALKIPGQPGYNKKEDALLGMISPPFERRDFDEANRWKSTGIYRFVDENNPWDDRLMDDIVVSVIERTSNAMLVRIDESNTNGSCSELPEANYKISKNKISINSLTQMGRTNLSIDFSFGLDYLNRDSLCSNNLCETRSIAVNNLWDTCYFEGDRDKTNLLSKGKVKISGNGQCKGPMTFKTRFSKSDRAFYTDKFSSNIICKPAYQCFYKIEDTIAFPVNGERKVNVKQSVEISTIYPNQWENILKRERSGLGWTDGPYESDTQDDPTDEFPDTDTDDEEQNLRVTLEAEDFDEKKGSVRAERKNGSNAQRNLGYIRTGDWVKYQEVDFGDEGMAVFEARIASRRANTYGRIEIYLDDLSGAPVGVSSNFSGKGGWGKFRASTLVLNSPIYGVHDVYLKFGMGYNLDWFSFSVD